MYVPRRAHQAYTSYWYQLSSVYKLGKSGLYVSTEVPHVLGNIDKESILVDWQLYS